MIWTLEHTEKCRKCMVLFSSVRDTAHQPCVSCERWLKLRNFIANMNSDIAVKSYSGENDPLLLPKVTQANIHVHVPQIFQYSLFFLMLMYCNTIIHQQKPDWQQLYNYISAFYLSFDYYSPYRLAEEKHSYTSFLPNDIISSSQKVNTHTFSTFVFDNHSLSVS